MNANPLKRRLLAGTCATFLVAANLAHAHEPDNKDGSTDGGQPGLIHRSSSMILPEIEGSAKPWSDKPVLNDPARFQFAVLTDRTGGHRPGIWMHAVRNLNQLRPEFAVSVGDLIEGYTDDEQAAEAEWTEFLGFIEQLDMRFFFVAGNHDVTNPMLHRLWRKHFGKEYYSFDYKGVHFLCLLSEDPSARLGTEQVEWALKDLEENKDARWTFVFLHKPLWVYAEREQSVGNSDPTNWKLVESALASRPHTVFAGHVHHYVQFERNGSEYYQLATTGGGSQLRGEPYGEFDHVVWVTMEEDRPRIANIRLDGVLSPDVVTEQSIERFRGFLNQARITVTPILIESGSELQSAEIEIQISNEFDELVTVQGDVRGLPLKGLSMDQSQFSVDVPPHDTKTVHCKFELGSAIDYEQFRHVTVTGTVRTKADDPLVAELTLPVTIDRRHLCPRIAVNVDGDLDEWSGEEEMFSESPSIFGASQQWQGPDDASIRFRLAHDDERFYLGGTVTDDQVISQGDRVYIRVDPRALESRLQNPRLQRDAFVIEVTPNVKDPSASRARVRSRAAANAPEPEFALKPIVGGYSFEVAIPKTLVTDVQGEDWSDLQLNVVLRDIDSAEDQEVFLSWRPVSDLRNRNTNYGFFFRAPQ